jgi:putative transposase
MKAHIVLVTKYRHPVITFQMLQRLREIFLSISQKWGVEIVEFNGESEHIHLLFAYYPQMQVSKYVNNLKTVSSRMIRKEFPVQVNKYYWQPYFWSEYYFVATCGDITVEWLRQYVQSQDSPSQSNTLSVIHSDSEPTATARNF